MEIQISHPGILEQIGEIRCSINNIAGAPEVLELVRAGDYHPDLRLGDAIQALDELAYALQEFLQASDREDALQKRQMILLPGALE